MLLIFALYSYFPSSVEAINFTEPVKSKNNDKAGIKAKIVQTAIPQRMFYITNLHAWVNQEIMSYRVGDGESECQGW